MKEIKYFLIFCLIINSMLGCKKSNNEETSLIKQKEYGTLYFVIDDIDTDIAVSCNNFLIDLDNFIYSLKIVDEKLLGQLLDKKEIDKNLGSDYVIDVRYRIELEGKVICIDDFGNYSVNNKFIGKISNFQILLDYIENNRESSVKFKEYYPFGDE